MAGSHFLYAAWVSAFVAALGSIFLGEVMGLPICTLCWYQRMALYPLVLLLPAAILLGDRRVSCYAMPFVLIGLAIAVYHNLLYYGFTNPELAPCTSDVPCTARQLELFGVLTIPVMSLVAFAIILMFLVCFQKRVAKMS